VDAGTAAATAWLECRVAVAALCSSVTAPAVGAGTGGAARGGCELPPRSLSGGASCAKAKTVINEAVSRPSAGAQRQWMRSRRNSFVAFTDASMSQPFRSPSSTSRSRVTFAAGPVKRISCRFAMPVDTGGTRRERRSAHRPARSFSLTDWTLSFTLQAGIGGRATHEGHGGIP